MKKTLLMFMLGFSMMATAQSCSNKPCCTNRNNATCQNASASMSNAEQVEIIYFHGKQRCPTCLAIESETKALMEEDLAKQVEANIVKMSVVDFSTEEGKEIAKKYKVAFSKNISSVLSAIKSGLASKVPAIITMIEAIKIIKVALPTERVIFSIFLAPLALAITIAAPLVMPQNVHKIILINE